MLLTPGVTIGPTASTRSGLMLDKPLPPAIERRVAIARIGVDNRRAEQRHEADHRASADRRSSRNRAVVRWS